LILYRQNYTIKNPATTSFKEHGNWSNKCWCHWFKFHSEHGCLCMFFILANHYSV